MVQALFADPKGKIYDHPSLEAAGASGTDPSRIPAEDLLPVPEGTRFFHLPGSRPIAFDPSLDAFSTLERVPVGRRKVTPLAVACFLPPGYTRTHLPAAHYPGPSPYLPLWAYTACGFAAGRFVAAAVRVDPVDHSEPHHYDDREILPRVEATLRQHPANRLWKQLKVCALAYHCLAAKNAFLGRWEMPLPASASCNADCVGCISLQPAGACQASHERVLYRLTAGEVIEAAVPHLREAEDAIVSFGQGCEGEPLLQVDLLEAVIRGLREKTDAGTINCNTNGSSAAAVTRLARAGLDSVRVSLNAARPETYTPYYRPRNYGWQDVADAIAAATANGVFTSINLLVFPGVTDREEEAEALFALIRRTGLHMVQMRNLNIDPRLYLAAVPPPRGKVLGIRRLLRLLRKEFAHVEIGYFNRPKALFDRRLCEQLPL
ncbi:MAG TPA: radical SAM protein [Candidatus Methylomirabilis sp.]|jgi:pyruvate-formate lyase-activating enzyme|nr:radical SAM protein [Candidatus Methylomirabilis sp.]